MAQNYLENRVSALAAIQLPDHVRMQYETFVLFAEAYYEFLEQKTLPQEVIQNIGYYGNIDETIDSFINYFYKNYIQDFPTNPAADKKHTLKRVNELYQHKGSEKAIKLLFRLLYNADVGFYYPEIQVFKSSAGRWRDKVSIFVAGDFFSLTRLIGLRVTGLVSGSNAKIKNVLLVKPEDNIVELELDRKSLNGSFAPNENIQGLLPTESKEFFILRVFNAFVNRDPTSTETIDYVESLDAGTDTPASIIKEVILSAEAETYLFKNIDFTRALYEQALGRWTSDDVAYFDSDISNRILAGSGREIIVDEVLALIDSKEYLKYVTRDSNYQIITANVRPIISNIVVANTGYARGYNYNVDDTFTLVTNLGNVTAKVAEVSKYFKTNFNSNLIQNPGNTWANGIVRIDLINDGFVGTVNVSSANIDTPNTTHGRSANLIVNIGALAEYSPHRSRSFIRGREVDLYDWKIDARSSVQETVISLPAELNGGAVFRGRKDNGSEDANTRAFIETVYGDMLGRAATNAEIITHKTTVKKANLSSKAEAYGQVIVDIVDSSEFKASNNYKNPENFIRTLYKVTQNRYPQTAEYNYYYQLINPASKKSTANADVKLQIAESLAKNKASQQHYAVSYQIDALSKQHVYYQPFSYELQSNQSFDLYKEIVKKLVHPAGLVFFGSNNITPQPIDRPILGGGKLPPKVSGIGSVKAVYQYLNVPIRVLKTLPLNARSTFAPVQKGIFSQVTKANADISYVGAGPHFETIDRWKFSYTATAPDQDQWQIQGVANILLDNFEAANIKQKYEIAPPLYTSNAIPFPWTFSLTPSSNDANEGQVITFTLTTGNVPDGTQVVYTIEESGTLANNDIRKGDVGLLLDGLLATSPTANAAYLKYQNPAAPSGYYYVNWSNVSYNECKANYTFNPVLAYCLMDGSSISSSANGWVLVDTNLLSVYDTSMGVRLKNMQRSGTDYDADSSDGILKTFSIPLPYNTRGVRIEYINLENADFADGTLNAAGLDQVYESSQGQTINLGSNFAHFGVSIHSANNSSNSYLSLGSLSSIQDTVQLVNFFGNAGSPVKTANAVASYFTQTDDAGFNIDRLVISQSDGAQERINLQNMRIWIR